MKNLTIFILIILIGGLLPACGRIQQGQVEAGGLNLEMAVEPEQPAVGPARLIFTLTDEAGQPVDDATLNIEGNMTHAGMVPVLAQATDGEAGRYVVPFEWTMGGDWIVTVEVSLADGREFSRQIPVSVQ
jgi:hypothetical protein